MGNRYSQLTWFTFSGGFVRSDRVDGIFCGNHGGWEVLLSIGGYGRIEFFAGEREAKARAAEIANICGFLSDEDWCI